MPVPSSTVITNAAGPTLPLKHAVTYSENNEVNFLRYVLSGNVFTMTSVDLYILIAEIPIMQVNRTILFRFRQNLKRR